MIIGIAGLGLIGGSLAKAVKKYTDNIVLGFDQDRQVMQNALSSGAVDGVLTDERLSGCGVVFVALYPKAAVEFVLSREKNFGPDTVVVDCCGVKQAVFHPCREASVRGGFVYIGGHPMAGTEKSGFANSSADLFKGASMVLTPPEEVLDESLKKVSDLCSRIGFGRIQISTPEQHDRMIALTSQLAHIISNAYVKSPNALNHAGFSAGSFKDMTRVARLNEDMWTELFLDNRLFLLNELNGLISRLNEYAYALERGDGEKLRALLREGRLIKEEVG